MDPFKTYADSQAMRAKASDIIMRACIASVIKETPGLNAQQLSDAAKELYNSLNWSASFLRMEQALPYGAPSSPTTLTWDPLNSSQLNNGRAAAVTYTQDDVFLGFAEMLTIDSRLIGQDAAADYQSFANPLHFASGAGSAVYNTTAASVVPLTAIYNGKEVIKVVNTDYRTAGSCFPYKQIPRISQTLATGAATGNYSFVPPFQPVQSDSVVLLCGQKKTNYIISFLPSPAIVIPTVAGTEIVFSKWIFGYVLPQGKSLYEALNGVII